MKSQKITNEALDNSKFWILNKKQSELVTDIAEQVVFVYESNDELIREYNKEWDWHIIIMNTSNEPSYPWTINIDDEACSSVAGFCVRDMNHFNEMCRGYGIQMESDFSIKYSKPQI